MRLILTYLLLENCIPIKVNKELKSNTKKVKIMHTVEILMLFFAAAIWNAQLMCNTRTKFVLIIINYVLTDDEWCCCLALSMFDMLKADGIIHHWWSIIWALIFCLSSLFIYLSISGCAFVECSILYLICTEKSLIRSNICFECVFEIEQLRF